METKESKSVGEWFELMPSIDQRNRLLGIAKIAVFAENAIWMEWRLSDPISAVQARDIRNAFAQHYRQKSIHKKWVDAKKQGPEPEIPEKPNVPKLELKVARNGLTWTKFSGSLCPGIKSYVYDSIANNVAKLYRKKRFVLLTFDERLPTSDKLRIRFRESACRILHHPDNSEWFRVQFVMDEGEPLVMDFKTRGKSPFTMDWLRELADTGEFPSGGTVSARKRKGKLVWQFSLSRTPRDGENQKVVEPVPGRQAIVYAPMDQHEFLICDVSANTGCPWRRIIEARDLLTVKRKHDELRRRMGHNYQQSPHGAGKGHGRRRAIENKERFTKRYEDRVVDWIENRTTEIVRFAVEAKCAEMRIEKLTDRDPIRLMLGDFPYHRLCLRMKQKAEAAEMMVGDFISLEQVKSVLSDAG